MGTIEKEWEKYVEDGDGTVHSDWAKGRFGDDKEAWYEATKAAMDKQKEEEREAQARRDKDEAEEEARAAAKAAEKKKTQPKTTTNPAPTTPPPKTTLPVTPQPKPVTQTGLTIGTATYGRSATGAKRLKAAFDTDIENLVKVLNGDKYTAFKKTVNANWVGADADDFLADIEKTRASLEKSIRALKTKFNSAVDADIQQFAKFQSKNVK